MNPPKSPSAQKIAPIALLLQNLESDARGESMPFNDSFELVQWRLEMARQALVSHEALLEALRDLIADCDRQGATDADYSLYEARAAISLAEKP